MKSYIFAAANANRWNAKGENMGMPKGLGKATNYYNRLEALRDWNKLASEVSAAGMSDLTAQYRPNEGDGWRKIDKAIAALRKAFQHRLQADAALAANGQAQA